MKIPFGVVEVAVPLPTVTLHPISDVHIGAHGCDREALERRVKFIKEADESHLVMLCGDLADIANKNGKSFSHGARTPDDEMEFMLDTFTDIADRVILILDGNHEDRISREVGLSFTQQFAARLGRASSYRKNYIGLVNLRYGSGDPKSQITTEHLAHHGFGGGATFESAMRACKLLTRFKVDATCYYMGHRHQYGTTTDSFVGGRPARRCERTYVLTNTYLDCESYGIKKGYGLPVIGSPAVELSVRRVDKSAPREPVIDVRRMKP